MSDFNKHMRWMNGDGTIFELADNELNGCFGCAFANDMSQCPTNSSGEVHCGETNIWKEVKMFNGTTKEDLNKVGVKFDSDKRQWWYLWGLLPELEQVVDILAYGDKKYPADDGSNWRRVEGYERRYSSALMRHLSLYLQGEKNDPETGKSHLAHMITNALFLMWFDRKSLD